MSTNRKQLSIFPSMPKERQFVDENGNITAAWGLYFQQLDTAIQTNYGAEGLVIPPQLNATIDTLVNSIPGTMIYANDAQVIRVAVPNPTQPPEPAPRVVIWKTLTPT